MKSFVAIWFAFPRHTKLPDRFPLSFRLKCTPSSLFWSPNISLFYLPITQKQAHVSLFIPSAMTQQADGINKGEKKAPNLDWWLMFSRWRKPQLVHILEVCCCASSLLHPVKQERTDSRKCSQHRCTTPPHVVLFTPQSIIKGLSIWGMGAALCQVSH